jgi:hypothetical protein
MTCEWQPPRERCHARTRTGRQCKAKAIEGGFVCRVHGGSAPQVQLAARRRVLAERVFMAYADWQDVHDADHSLGQMCSLREADALGRIAIAERELEAHDADAELLAVLRAAVRQQRRAGLDPGVRADLLEVARARCSRPAA